jgi:copper chaperone CopZ
MADETIRFSVPGMTCGHCVAAVRGELEKVAGVRAVSVDLDTKQVEVTGDALDRASLADAVDEAGYEPVGLAAGAP